MFIDGPIISARGICRVNAVFLVLKKFKRSYFDLIMHKFTPDTFRIDRVFFSLYGDILVSSFIIFNYFSIRILVFRSFVL